VIVFINQENVHLIQNLLILLFLMIKVNFMVLNLYVLCA